MRKNLDEKILNEEVKRNGMTEFKELLEEVAELSEQDRVKVTIYVQGYLAGRKS